MRTNYERLVSNSMTDELEQLLVSSAHSTAADLSLINLFSNFEVFY